MNVFLSSLVNAAPCSRNYRKMSRHPLRRTCKAGNHLVEDRVVQEGRSLLVRLDRALAIPDPISSLFQNPFATPTTSYIHRSSNDLGKRWTCDRNTFSGDGPRAIRMHRRRRRKARREKSSS